MTMSDHNRYRSWKPWTAALLGLLLVAGVSGCEEGFLEVNDPDVVPPESLEGPANVSVRINTIIGDFQEAMDQYVLYTGLFTDEMILSGTFPTRIDVDERVVQPNNGTLNGDLYEPLHVSRASADDGVAAFEQALGADAFSEVQAEVRDGIAFGKLYGGYDRIFFSELYCQSIFGGNEGESAPVGPDARMEEALTLLREAETAASEAGLPTVASAARVGQGRALLWLGRYQEAADAVSEVADGFYYPAEYSGNTTAQANEVWQLTYGTQGFSARWTVGDGTAGNRHNERWPYFEEWVDQNLLQPENNVRAPEIGVPIVLQTVYDGAGNSIPVATGWEARMIEAEALLQDGQFDEAEQLVNDLLSSPGVNPLTTSNFSLNDGQPPELGAFDPVDFTAPLSEDDVRELARARAAGLWLSGTRQGTLRRFIDQYGVDLYPQGTQGTATSFPVTEQELENNDNIDSACGG